MKDKHNFWLFLFISLCFFSAHARTKGEPAKTDTARIAPDFRAYDMLHLPDLRGEVPPKSMVTIAVIDDGFSFTNKTCWKYFYKNSKEIPNNGKDDDANGYIDDICGWDAADRDNDVSIPAEKDADFYHGTMVAGIIITILERSLGATAADHIRILPVKISSDISKTRSSDAAYEGIAYAVRQGADIICCAWSGVQMDAKYKGIFEEAERRGILIIAASGDTYSEQIDPPASLTSVYAVSAVDSGFRRIKSAGYGAKVDLVAYGDAVWAPHPAADNAFTYDDGTEAATALVVGCAAMLKVALPQTDSRALMRALRNTARPLDSLNPAICAKLGAGFIDPSAAYDYLKYPDRQENFFISSRPRGDILISKKATRNEWLIAPYGGYSGFVFTFGAIAAHLPDARLKFYSSDTLFSSIKLSDFPVRFFVPGSRVKVVYDGAKSKDPVTLSYVPDVFDSATMYCSKTQVFEEPHGMITDGSGAANYASKCSCKWQIKAPAGKHIRIEFDEFDTEANKDFVWIFDGEATLQENILAKFSGDHKPPVITSRSNELLLWFVTDEANTGKGWRLHYDFVDTPGGVEFPDKKK